MSDPAPASDEAPATGSPSAGQPPVPDPSPPGPDPVPAGGPHGAGDPPAASHLPSPGEPPSPLDSPAASDPTSPHTPPAGSPSQAGSVPAPPARPAAAGRDDRAAPASPSAPDPDDPLAAVPLQPGERVLWSGRPGFGLSRTDLRTTFRMAVVWLVCSAVCGLCCFSAPLSSASTVAEKLLVVGLIVTLSFGPPLLFAASTLAAGYLGGGRWMVALALATGPFLVGIWGYVWATAGPEAAFALLTGPYAALAVAFAIAVGRIAWLVLHRLHIHYFITDRRVIAVQSGLARRRRLVVVPLPQGRLELRVIWPFGGRRTGRGHIAIGAGQRRRILAYLERPDLVLAEVRRALKEGGR